MALPAALQALSGSRATRVALIAAVTLSVLLNLVFLSLYLHGSTHSAEWHHASRAEATPNATAEEVRSTSNAVLARTLRVSSAQLGMLAALVWWAR